MLSSDRKVQMNRLKALAKNGNSELAWIIGEGYLDGYICLHDGKTPVRRNRKAAERWLRIASEQGNGNAMLALSSLLIKNYGENCYAEALAWEMKAIELRMNYAAHNAAITASMMGKRKMAYRLLKTSYNECPAETSLLLGVCLFAGYGCRRDIKQAELYFLQGAAAHNNLDANRVKAIFFVSAIQHGVPFSVRTHIGVEQPPKIFDHKSVDLFRKLAKNAALSMPAQCALAETLAQLVAPK